MGFLEPVPLGLFVVDRWNLEPRRSSSVACVAEPAPAARGGNASPERTRRQDAGFVPSHPEVSDTSTEPDSAEPTRDVEVVDTSDMTEADDADDMAEAGEEVGSTRPSST